MWSSMYTIIIFYLSSLSISESPITSESSRYVMKVLGSLEGAEESKRVPEKLDWVLNIVRLQFNGFAWLLLPIVTCCREFY